MGKLDEYTKNGYWEVTSAPVEKNDSAIKLQEMEDLIKKSQARHRGWPFPFTRKEDTKLMNQYLESITIGDRVPKYEGFRLYENGLFYWKGDMWENFAREYGEHSLSYVAANWKITEILLFLKRLYSDILKPNDSITIKIKISGCSNRSFYDDHEYVVPFSLGRCDEHKIVFQKTINYSTLKSSWQEIAIEFIQRLVTLFKAEKIKDETVRNMQDKLLKMKMI